MYDQPTPTDRRTDTQTALLSAYLYESEYAEELSTRTQLQRELYFSNRDFQSIHPKNMNVSSDWASAWVNVRVLLAPGPIEISMCFIYGTWTIK